MQKAVDLGATEIAWLVSGKTIEMMQAIVQETLDQARLCDRCVTSGQASTERMQQRLKLIVDQMEEQANPTPMCKETPSAIAHACPNCGCKTDRVEPDPSAVQGSDLSRAKFVCPRCKSKKGEVPSSYCWRCTGRGWVKGISAGGSRIVKEKCGVCEGTGER